VPRTFANRISRAIFGVVGVKGFYSVSATGEPVAGDGPYRSASIPESAGPESATAPLTSVSHEALFQLDAVTRCDACDEPLPAVDDSGAYSPQGRAVYLWQRGGEPRFETAPLCPACAAAIGMTALARWEIEEEEG
jgi:hypothetical protein